MEASNLFPKDFHGFRIMFQKILLCGGYDKQTPTKCWIYDHNLSNWFKIGDMPYARADHEYED